MAHDTSIDGYYVGSNGDWIYGIDNHVKNTICGKWKGFYIDDSITGVIDSTTICDKQYKVEADKGSSIIIDVYNNDGTIDRMMFCNFTDNQMSMYWYNSNTKSYTGCTTLTRVE